MLEDPRPAKYRNLGGYNDYVRNSVLNFCSHTSIDIALRHIYPKADIQQASSDHNYLQETFTEYWVDEALAVSTSYRMVLQLQYSDGYITPISLLWK